jgi:hypothetical protein
MGVFKGKNIKQRKLFCGWKMVLLRKGRETFEENFTMVLE